MQEYTIAFTEPAKTDLERIREHIGQNNKHSANKTALKIVESCDLLEQFPRIGREGIVIGTRELVVLKDYIVVYRISFDVVEVLRIWHGAEGSNSSSSSI